MAKGTLWPVKCLQHGSRQPLESPKNRGQRVQGKEVRVLGTVSERQVQMCRAARMGRNCHPENDCCLWQAQYNFLGQLIAKHETSNKFFITTSIPR